MPRGRDLSRMSEGLDPVAGLSAGSCLINRASVSLGSLTLYATKCTGRGITFQHKSLTLTQISQIFSQQVCACFSMCEISKVRISECVKPKKLITHSKWLYKYSVMVCKSTLDFEFINPQCLQ